jgi:predicted dehydrogenase
MSEGRLKTAVVGLDERGLALLEGVLRLEDIYALAAVADATGDLAQAIGKRHAVAWFDDLRQMLIQKDLDLLVASAPLYIVIDHLHAAMRKGCHILRCPPAARSFGELSALLETARANRVFFAAARPWRHRRNMQSMKHFIEEHPEEQFYLAEAWCAPSAREENSGWRKDPYLAGGGAILHAGWMLIDVMVWLFGVPQQVYTLCTNQAPDRTQRRSLTEETAIVSMRFDDRLIGKLILGRTMSPPGWLLRVSGRNCQLLLNEKAFTVRDVDGRTVAETRQRDSEQTLTDRMLRGFGSALAGGDHAALENEPKQLLDNMSLIQAAYLSDKTGLPEEPARIVQMPKR